MGCVASKNVVVTPAVDSSGILRDHRERSGPITTSSQQYQTVQVTRPACLLRKEEKEGNCLELEEYGKASAGCTTSQSFRLENLNKYIEGEQVAAGWPSWLSAVAGDAIQGWVPLKADAFEKLEKVRL